MRLRAVAVVAGLTLLLFLQTNAVMAQGPSDPQPPPDDIIWIQTVEEWGTDTDAVFPDDYYRTPTYPCDSDTGDDEYVFIFNWWYDQDPDSLKWNGDWAIRSTFGDLKGFATAWDEVRICMNPVKVNAVGGPNHIMNYFRLNRQ